MTDAEVQPEDGDEPEDDHVVPEDEVIGDGQIRPKDKPDEDDAA